MIAQLPHSPWKPSEIAKIKRLGSAYLQRVQSRRDSSVSVLRNLLDCAAKCLSLGGHLTIIWPKYVTAWLRKEVIEFIAQHSLYTADYNLDLSQPLPDADETAAAERPVKGVSFRVCSSSQSTVQALAAAGGANKAVRRLTAEAVQRCILTSLFGYGKFVPAMGCKPVETTQHIDNVISED